MKRSTICPESEKDKSCEVMTQVKFCNKANCENFPLDPIKSKLNDGKCGNWFNGIGRIDPIYPDPFEIIRSNRDLNIDFMIKEIDSVRF